MRKLTTEEFINKARGIWGNKYDYSKAVYVTNKKNIAIICPIHGEFLQIPSNHIHGKHGCPKCGCEIRSSKTTFTIDEFIFRARKIHGVKYNYSKVVYINNCTKVIIICPTHGEFLQIPNNHLAGRGCPHCRKSKGELLISKILNKNNVNYVMQKTFPDCKNIKKLPYDLYLPQQNMLIEYNGIQHYEHRDYMHRNGHTLEKQQRYDLIKKQYAINNGYRFLVIKYNENENVEQILERELKHE